MSTHVIRTSMPRSATPAGGSSLVFPARARWVMILLVVVVSPAVMSSLLTMLPASTGVGVRTWSAPWAKLITSARTPVLPTISIFIIYIITSKISISYLKSDCLASGNAKRRLHSMVVIWVRTIHVFPHITWRSRLNSIGLLIASTLLTCHKTATSSTIAQNENEINFSV